MRGVSAFVLAALAACSVSAQDARETQPSASTQVEEIYVVRSVPEPPPAGPAGFCTREQTGFGGAAVDAQLTLRSTATQASEGRMVDPNVKTVGTIHTCLAPTQNPDIRNFYAEGVLGSTPFKGVGECFGRKTDFPEQGLRAFNCFLDLSGLPSGYVGGQLTTNSMLSPKGQGP